MMFVQNWGEVFTNSLQGIWYGVASFLPTLIIAIIIFAIGWVLASLVEKIIESIFKSLKVDTLLKGAGVDDVMKRTGHPLNSGAFVGALVKWFIIVVFLIASFDILNLAEVNLFLRNVVLGYIPQVIIAVLILMVSVVIAEALQKVVTASAHAAHVKSAHLLGVITRWAIWIFAILAALIQLNIAAGIINMLVTGIIAGAALAFGLAFGLGGKEHASDIIGMTLKKLEERE
jgi:hypothetical protein